MILMLKATWSFIIGVSPLLPFIVMKTAISHLFKWSQHWNEPSAQKCPQCFHLTSSKIAALKRILGLIFTYKYWTLVVCASHMMTSDTDCIFYYILYIIYVYYSHSQWLLPLAAVEENGLTVKALKTLQRGYMTPTAINMHLYQDICDIMTLSNNVKFDRWTTRLCTLNKHHVINW